MSHAGLKVRDQIFAIRNIYSHEITCKSNNYESHANKRKTKPLLICAFTYSYTKTGVSSDDESPE